MSEPVSENKARLIAQEEAKAKLQTERELIMSRIERVEHNLEEVSCLQKKMVWRLVVPLVLLFISTLGGALLYHAIN